MDNVIDINKFSVLKNDRLMGRRDLLIRTISKINDIAVNLDRHLLDEFLGREGLSGLSQASVGTLEKFYNELLNRDITVHVEREEYSETALLKDNLEVLGLPERV